MNQDLESHSESSSDDGFEDLQVNMGIQARIGMSEHGLRAENYNNLNVDILRREEDEDSGSDSDNMFDDKKKKKKPTRKSKNRGQNNLDEDEDEDEEIQKQEKVIVLEEVYDFRRGPKHWPRFAELISPEKGKELIEKCVDDVNKKQEREKKALGKGTTKKDDEEEKKEEDDDDEDGDGKKKAIGPSMGPGMGRYRSDSDDEKVLSFEETLLNPEEVGKKDECLAPSDAKFEYARDRSTSLLIPYGYRLKLDVSGLTKEGMKKRKKKEKERIAALFNKRDVKPKKKSNFWSSSGWGDDVGWGFKNYINEWTITMDIKLKEKEVPREGLALFQTSLVYLEENPASGKKTVKQSEGECIISQSGGVGIFGIYGDVSQVHKVDSNRWHRVVVSVRCVNEGKGEMKTWIDSKPCATVKKDAFLNDGRFALDADNFFYLFSSSKPNMMGGNVLLRHVSITLGVMTDDTVKLNHANNLLLSMFEIEREAKMVEQAKGLSLAKLFPKPRPIWNAPALIATFGDPFVERTAYEGNSILSWCYVVVDFVLREAFKVHTPSHASLFEDFSAEERQVVSYLLHTMNLSRNAFMAFVRLLVRPSESQVLFFLGKLKKWLTALNVGETIILPAFAESTEFLIIVMKESELLFTFTFVQSDAEKGLRNHASKPPVSDTSKIKFRSCLVLKNINKKNALDSVFWMGIYCQVMTHHEGDMNKVYDVLIPFLTGKPLDANLIEAEFEASREKGEGVDGFGEYQSPQRSDTAYARCLFSGMKHVMKSRGLSVHKCKRVKLAMKAQFVRMIANDLSFVLADQNGVKVCEMCVQQLSYHAGKLMKLESNDQLAVKILQVVSELNKQVEDRLYQDLDRASLPQLIELRDGRVEDDGEVKKHEEKPVEFMKEEGKGGKISIKWMAGTRTDTLVLSAESSVGYLKYQISQSLGTADELKLIYQGRLLDRDEAMLHACDVKDGSTVQVLVKEVGKDEEEKPPADRAEAAKKVKDDLRNFPEDNARPTLDSQYFDSLLYNLDQTAPNPGLSVNLRKYVPVDMLQMPAKVETREDAIRAIRICDRLCTLIDNQPHCVKNDRFLIGALIQHTFTQLVPLPKPQQINKSERDTQKRARNYRSGGALSATLDLKCVWNDMEIRYELQVELLMELSRICEHFIACVFSLYQDRSYDGTVIVTLGCIAAIADSIMRKRATDLPSEVCTHLNGETRDGERLGFVGFGVGVANFASQTETLEMHTPELCAARCAVLDYFRSPLQRSLQKIFSWETHYELKPDRNLIKYLRNIQREIGHGDAATHMLLLDPAPVEQSILKKNYPELRCFRDIVFWWKTMMNTDVKAFPNYVDVKRNPNAGVARFGRLAAQLHWGWEQTANAAGYLVSCNYQHVVLRCRPEPDRDAKGDIFNKERPPPTHRYESTALPSFYVADLPPIRTEDDVIYKPNLPGFEESKKKGHVLGQYESELLLSYLTVPYIRLPLVLTFFASEERLHKLQSKALRQILDAVLFEPGRHLSLEHIDEVPAMVPSPQPELLAAPYGMLINDLCTSPDLIMKHFEALLEGALALDTGSVCDKEDVDFNSSVDIILYIIRTACRVLSYTAFLLDDERNKTLTSTRGLLIDSECRARLVKGREMLERKVCVEMKALLEDYLNRLDEETRAKPNDNKLIDRNSRLTCDLHAHILLMHRNVKHFNETVAHDVIGSFVYLTTRHTFNRGTREFGKLLVPETQVYDVLQYVRRKLVTYCRQLQQGSLDLVMQTSLQVATSNTGSLKKLETHNRWAKISGKRCIGRFAVGSTRTVAEEKREKDAPRHGGLLVNKFDFAANVPSVGLSGLLAEPGLGRQGSHFNPVMEISDSGMLGVELDLQIGQMTLRSKHLSALPTEVASHPDVKEIFGNATIQSSLLEKGANRSVYRLVGRHHDLEYWGVAATEGPPLNEIWDREYDPSDLVDSESWIYALFEPIRKAFFSGPVPPAMSFLMQSRPTSETAEVCVLLGLNPATQGPYKLVYVYKKLCCVHIYQITSLGRRFFMTLTLTTDVRLCLREMQPSWATRFMPPPYWWTYGAGDAYPPGNTVNNIIYDDVVNPTNMFLDKSVVIFRDSSHPDNLSCGKEMYVPSRFLLGAIPQCLLDAYRFWMDEACAEPGYARLLGYPVDPKEDLYLLRVEMQLVAKGGLTIVHGYDQTNEASGFRSVRVVRRERADVLKERDVKLKLSSLLEVLGNLLVKPGKKKSGKKDETKRDEEKKEVGDFIQVGAMCEYALRSNTWVDCLIYAVYDEDVKTVDVELKGTTYSGLVLKGVHSRDLRKKAETDEEKKAQVPKEGEGIYKFEGLSDSDEEDWGASSGDEDEEDEEKERKKDALSFEQIDRMGLLVEACRGDLDTCVRVLSELSTKKRTREGDAERKKDELDALPTSDIFALARLVQVHAGFEAFPLVYHMRSIFSSKDMIMLNLLHSQKGSRLHSIMRTLTRIENLSNMVAWSRDTKSVEINNGAAVEGVPSVDLIELPRLKLTFTTKRDFNGNNRLYSTDHADLFITNERNDRVNQMLQGIPHSLLLGNSQGENFVLVPLVSLRRPIFTSQPFSTHLVLDRADVEFNASLTQRYFIYPIHVSLSFLMTKGIDSALYLLLLRFLNRDYGAVFKLADSIGTDTEFSNAGNAIFRALYNANDDWHPDAHVCRLKIALVTLDSGLKPPFDVTIQKNKYARFITKVAHASCQLTYEEEKMLLEAERLIVYEVGTRGYKKALHTPFVRCLLKNRQQIVASLMDAGVKEINCYVPARVPLSSWPYLTDNTVFGEVYSGVKEVKDLSEWEKIFDPVEDEE